MLNPQAAGSNGTRGPWHITIVTPDGVQLKSVATLVELSAMDGQIGVMPGHERLMTVLEMGELVIHNGPRRQVYLVSGGFARIQPGRLSVLAFSIEQTADAAALERCRARRCALLGDAESDPLSSP